jgi:hypothetical protein
MALAAEGSMPELPSRVDKITFPPSAIFMVMSARRLNRSPGPSGLARAGRDQYCSSRATGTSRACGCVAFSESVADKNRRKGNGAF